MSSNSEFDGMMTQAFGNPEGFLFDPESITTKVCLDQLKEAERKVLLSDIGFNKELLMRTRLGSFVVKTLMTSKGEAGPFGDQRQLVMRMGARNDLDAVTEHYGLLLLEGMSVEKVSHPDYYGYVAPNCSIIYRPLKRVPDTNRTDPVRPNPNEHNAPGHDLIQYCVTDDYGDIPMTLQPQAAEFTAPLTDLWLLEGSGEDRKNVQLFKAE